MDAQSECVVIQRVIGVEAQVAVVVHRRRTDRLGHIEIEQVVLVVGKAQSQRHRGKVTLIQLLQAGIVVPGARIVDQRVRLHIRQVFPADAEAAIDFGGNPHALVATLLALRIAHRVAPAAVRHLLRRRQDVAGILGRAGQGQAELGRQGEGLLGVQVVAREIQVEDGNGGKRRNSHSWC